MSTGSQTAKKTGSSTRLIRLIRLIHVGKRALCMDDDTYREALVAATGKNSTTTMSERELMRVVDHFKSRGFQIISTKPTDPRPKADDPQSRMIRGLWIDLHNAGSVRNPSEAALAAYVKRMTGVDALQWCSATQKSRVIESLKDWLARAKKGGDNGPS